MSRKKRKKKLRIKPQTLARPRLDALLARRQRSDLDDAGFVAGVEALMGELGREPVLNALVAQLDNADDDQRELLMGLIPQLGDKKVIGYLWRLVEKSRMSIGAKMTALVILKQMGEDVDLEDPGVYFSWRDIKTADIAEVQKLGQASMRAIIREIQQLTDAQDLEALMMRHEEIVAQTGGDETQLAVIESLVDMADTGAADMLMALVYTTPHSVVREAARRALTTLAGRGILPQSPAVKALGEEPFYTAYCTDPAHPWQQQVSLLWERPGNRVQAAVFLLDFGHPWKGSIKDMFVTRYMTKGEWQREFVAKGERQGIPQRQVPYARARQFILDALAANKKHRQPLPPEYDQFLHLIERRILNPSPAALAQAEAMPIKDEWGQLQGPVVRGMQVIEAEDGSPLVLLDDMDTDS
jgi:hypothetical protein